jgi:hypothetical protein
MLALTLPSLSVSASLSASLSLAAQIGEMARLMLNLGVGFNPDPAWLQIKFPTISLSASAMATLSAFVQLQATMALLGLNLTTSFGASAFADLSASVAARMSAILSLGLSINPGPWLQLSAALQACAQIQAALKLNLFAPININMSVWANFLLELQLILPMLSIVAQLGLTGNISAQLALALKIMLGIPMPKLPTASLTLMASLTTTLTAIAQIKLALGIDPLAIGLPAVHLMVQERIQATVSMVESMLGMSFSAALQFLAKLQLGPTMIASPLNVRLAANLQLPPINWQIPMMASLPVLSIGLPIAAFMAQLKAALNLNMALSPCMAGCDMAALGL